MENKRDIWSYDETQILINIIKEKNILKIMDNKRFRIAEIFKSLEKDMKSKGYCRSAKQIHIKFKALKRNYNNYRTELSKSGAGVTKKCAFYDELHEIFGCRPVNFQKGMDSLNTVTSIDINMYDNVPDADGAIPGCSKVSDEFNSSFSNKNEYHSLNIDKTSISSISTDKSISDTDSIDYIEDNSSITSNKDKEEIQELETSIKNATDNSNVAMLLESNKDKDCKKRIKSARSTNRQTFAQVFDNCVQKLIKSNEDITKLAIETQKNMITNILKQQENMLQQQTQILVNNLHVNTSQFPVTRNYFSNLDQLKPQLQSFNNPRFVKVPLNIVQSAEKSLPVIVTPPSTPTPLSSFSTIPFSASVPISTTSPITSFNLTSTSTSSQVTK